MQTGWPKWLAYLTPFLATLPQIWLKLNVHGGLNKLQWSRRTDGSLVKNPREVGFSKEKSMKSKLWKNFIWYLRLVTELKMDIDPSDSVKVKQEGAWNPLSSRRYLSNVFGDVGGDTPQIYM